MSLTLRINIILTVLLLLVFSVASIFVSRNIQRVILKEVSHSSNTTMDMIKTIITDEGMQEETKRQLIIYLSALTDTQLLHIESFSPNGRFTFRAIAAKNEQNRETPAWFSKLVSFESPPFFSTGLPDSPGSRIQIGIDPSNRVDEAWLNTKPLLGLALLFAGLCYLLVFLSVRSTLKPVISIINALDLIEKGKFETRLPRFNSPELSHISKKINGVAQTLEQASDLEQTMAKHAVLALEKERQYLARELHDELGQSISAIKALAVSSGCIDKKSDNSTSKTIESLCDNIYGVVNSLMRRLRPAALEELGLVVALRQMVDEWNDKQSEIFCKLSIIGQFQSIDSETAIHLFRVVQEGLTNVSKHSDATEVSILLKEETHISSINLLIKDNGSGANCANSQMRYGLRGIKERINALRGKVVIESPQAGGFLIQCYVPIEPSDVEGWQYE